MQHFLDKGAELHIPAEDFLEKLKGIRNFIFDWDGVFNRGIKMDPAGSPFSEPDSMGTNLMRLSCYLKHGMIARMGILTGAQNEGAYYFAHREHFDMIIRGYKDKNTALRMLLGQFELDRDATLFAWDDILDLPVAAWAGVSIQVRRDANPVLNSYTKQHGLADYTTAFPGGSYAVREISELFLSAQGNSAACIEARMQYSQTYQDYLALKQETGTAEIRKR